ncbi:ABC transporter permease [Frigoribacterium sp. PhB24]|uniref:ABC transporter permease n=1 Tax=Frigoribacterium sp. PhB24 TaxID=2485204 RepID=UPI000F49693E|nr:ABC transporter permease [Frigoribacterium sp. PhB24]ROS57784.1 putative ABC transport system permease protein [Frigoribacterium sp. PhB24]
MSARDQLLEHRPSILVAALGTTFGVGLLGVTRVFEQVIATDPAVATSGTVSTMLGFVASVFVGLALYVGAIVTANTFTTVVAGRTPTIALMRLLGSSARDQRRAVAREGLVVGVAGAVLGTIVGLALVVVAVRVLVGRGQLPDLAYSYVSAGGLVPAVAVVLTTVAAAWVGSRRVLQVTPLQATDAAQDAPLSGRSRRVVRTVFAALLVVGGGLLLVIGVVVGLADAMGVLVAFFGGVLSFTGVVVGAHSLMPTVLNGVGRLFGTSQVARLAAENAVRQPERSTRATIGIVIGVTLVTTLSVALETLRSFIYSIEQDSPYAAELDQFFTTTLLIVAALVGFSAVIAAVGMVNDMSLSVLQRRRELGLLRAIGSTAGQVRRMILLEATQMALTAIVVGVVLGVVYGWAGAQSLLGSANGGLIAPALPVPLLVGLAVTAAVLAGVAALVPARRATSVTPVEALATR